jgi:SanA protein
MRWLKRIILGLVMTAVLLVAGCNLWIIGSTRSDVYSDVTQLPTNRIALVLGTSHRTSKGGPNPFFHKRIEMAARLYHERKVAHFILSGDNSTRYYNEPLEMKKALEKRGVPSSVITLDYAGLRTLDSVVRSKKIFGQNRITIITQPFHSYRALFISHYYDIDAVAMVADEPALDESLRVRMREYLARTMAVLDLYVFKTGPRFLGEKEEINVAS